MLKRRHTRFFLGGGGQEGKICKRKWKNGKISLNRKKNMVELHYIYISACSVDFRYSWDFFILFIIIMKVGGKGVLRSVNADLDQIEAFVDCVIPVALKVIYCMSRK